MTRQLTDELAALRDAMRPLATERGGVFRREQLRGLGVDDSVVRPMLRRGWWVRLWHGVYADAATVTAAERTPEARHLLRTAAAIAALPLPVYAFGPTASIVHGVPADRRLLGRISLVRESRTDLRAFQRRISSNAPGLDVDLRTRPEIDNLTTTVGGIPTVERDLAAVSTAASSGREWAVATLDAVAWQDETAVARLVMLAREWDKLLGIGAVRRALPLVRTGAQTPLESFSRVRLTDIGLPEPELQVPVHDDAGFVGIVDMWFDDLRVVGEADGLLKYRTRADLILEKAREDRIRATRKGVARWTWDEIIRQPAAVGASIRRASPRRFAA